MLRSSNVDTYLSEPNQHTQELNDWTLTYDQLSAGKFESHLKSISFSGIQLYQEKIKPAMFQRGEGIKDALCLGFFADLSMPALWMGKAMSGQEILSVSNGGDILLKTSENCSFYSLTMPFELLSSTQQQPSSACAPFLASDYSGQFYQQYLTIFKHVLNQSECLHNQVARAHLQSDLIGLTEKFLATFSHQQNIEKVSKQRAKQVVKTACEALQENHHDVQSIEQLCAMTHTSRRTLQNCFEQMTGQSPAAFLKKLRLNAVQRILANSTTPMVITDVAMDWGFWHLSQFAVDYKKLFGESPSQTLSHNAFHKK